MGPSPRSFDADPPTPDLRPREAASRRGDAGGRRDADLAIDVRGRIASCRGGGGDRSRRAVGTDRRLGPGGVPVMRLPPRARRAVLRRMRCGKVTPPTTYAEWAVLLDNFGAGDDEAILAMAAGHLEGGSGVTERWVKRITDCQNHRLTRLDGQLASMLSRTRDPMALSMTLIVVRKALDLLRAFAAIDAFPEDVRTFLRDQIGDWASRQQTSLERSAAAPRDDRDRLLKLLRDTSLTTVAPAPAHPQTAPGPTGRRVIL